MTDSLTSHVIKNFVIREKIVNHMEHNMSWTKTSMVPEEGNPVWAIFWHIK